MDLADYNNNFYCDYVVIHGTFNKLRKGGIGSYE